tara:strand:+ start:111 stop:422 length:312 start_codon:yes stop_codon:yes gene_type:complete
MSEVKILRMSTGEDVIGKVTISQQLITIEKSFVIIPTQSAPGKPVQLMMSPYMPYSADDEVIIDESKVVTMVTPKPEILKSYQQNTSSIIAPKPELITETKLP